MLTHPLKSWIIPVLRKIKIDCTPQLKEDDAPSQEIGSLHFNANLKKNQLLQHYCKLSSELK